MEHIGDFAFQDCCLTSVSISSSVTHIGAYAFDGCNYLTRFYVDENNLNYCSDASGVLLTADKTGLIRAPGMLAGTYDIPDTVKTINSYAFGSCKSLVSVTIPESVITIGFGAFEYCTSLTEVAIPNSVTNLVGQTFSGCSRLVSVKLPCGITEISSYMFRWCISLTSIDIPDSVTHIGEATFAGCTSLASIYLTENITSIGDYAFNGCTNMTAIWVSENNPKFCSDEYGFLFNKDKTILGLIPCGYSGHYSVPEGVVYIAQASFNNNRNLTSITIPDSVTNIRCFEEEWNGLTDVYYAGTEKQWVSIGFEAPQSVTIHYNHVHSYGEWTITIQSTCSATGIQKRICTVCCDEQFEDIPTVEHNYGTWSLARNATCEEDGCISRTCNDCQAKENVTITATGHSLITEITEPTCTEQGYSQHTCSTCGYSYADSYIAAIGHAYETVIKDATCTEDGFTKHTCIICDDSHITDEVTAFGHSFGNWSIGSMPSCEAEGFLYRICNTCQEKETNSVAANGHSFVDGICTNCGKVELIPTLTMRYPSLSFEDEIFYNVYYTVDDTANIVEMGLISFDSKLTDGTIADATDVIPGYVFGGEKYMVHTNGIPAKNLGDAVYFKVYAKLSDGSYAYSDVAAYHAVAYANSILNNASYADDVKALMVAMLNYGAAAQVQFGYKTDALMNAHLTAEQQALVTTYDESMVDNVVKADSSKVGSFVMNGGYSNIWPTVSFEGAFSINYYFTPSNTPDSGLTFYYWDAATYNSVDVLTAENAAGTIQAIQDGINWGATVDGIAAKEMDETIYVAATYTANGTTYNTSVIAYSLGKYCETIATEDGSIGAATAVYGYYAKNYFGSIS